jgi:Uma2 family endonuclease
MNEPAMRRATYEDVLNSPSNMIAQVIDGALHLSPRPASPHAAASSALSDELGPPFKRGRGGPGGWIIIFEPELHLGVDILVPDLAGWKRERLPKLPDAPYLTLAPDWICEVLSPGTTRIDRYEKRSIYARESVPHLWLVDPRVRTLEVFELINGRWTDAGVYADDAVIRAVPFDAIELRLGLLWADVEQSATQD